MQKNYFMEISPCACSLMVVAHAKSKSYSTQYSQVVPHLSTNYANTSLTSEIGRDLVLSSVYGHN